MGQAPSSYLTQTDVEELIADTKGACELGGPVEAARRLARGCQGVGISLQVTQTRAIAPPPSLPAAVSQQEVEALYKRFRTLDRGRKVRVRDQDSPQRLSGRAAAGGAAALHHAALRPTSPPLPQGFITSEEFLTIPELSINPLAKRLAYLFESINFKEFLVRGGLGQGQRVAQDRRAPRPGKVCTPVG